MKPGDIQYDPAPALVGAELDELDSLLTEANPDEAMVVEELDGFFAGLACGPVPVPEAEYLPLVFAKDPAEVRTQFDHKRFERLLKLINRHRNSVFSQLYLADGFSPIMLLDEDGQMAGNAWAIGFVRAMALRQSAWEEAEDAEAIDEALEPLMRLVDEAAGPQESAGETPAAAAAGDAGETGEVISEEEREGVIDAMLEGVQEVYGLLRKTRENNLKPVAPIRRKDRH